MSLLALSAPYQMLGAVAGDIGAIQTLHTYR